MGSIRKNSAGSPLGGGGSSFGLFAFGAIFPVAPFFWLDGYPAVLAGVAFSSLALMFVGVGTSLFTGRGVAFSVARQLLSGLAAAGLTYGIGRLVGVSLGG